jgi:poly-gamma-glutamate synthase PgsB/CapB
MILFICLFGILLTYLVWEKIYYQRLIQKIPIRILVNGTRGKSSVVRLISNGLRNGGYRVLSKTTGTEPRLILPDGSEDVFPRSWFPNIKENRSLFVLANQLKVDAVVVECMALEPELQWALEYYWVKATMGVITNVRLDHLDCMGNDIDQISSSIASFIPYNAKLVIKKEYINPFIEKVADQRNTKIHCVVESQPWKETKQYIEHPENIAIALEVCKLLNVPLEKVQDAIQNTSPDPGALNVYEIEYFKKKIHYYNGFSANDPESSKIIWGIATNFYEDSETKIIILNLREDRWYRSEQLAEEISTWNDITHLIVLGSGIDFFKRKYQNKNRNIPKVIYCESMVVSEVFELILEQCKEDNLIVGIGNAMGLGKDITKMLRNRS